MDLCVTHTHTYRMRVVHLHHTITIRIRCRKWWYEGHFFVDTLYNVVFNMNFCGRSNASQFACQPRTRIDDVHFMSLTLIHLSCSICWALSMKREFVDNNFIYTLNSPNKAEVNLLTFSHFHLSIFLIIPQMTATTKSPHFVYQIPAFDSDIRLLAAKLT